MAKRGKRAGPNVSNGELSSSVPWWQLALLIAVVALVYSPVLELGWIWDDDQYVTNNPLLSNLSGLSRIWLEPQASPQYYPVVFTCLWMEFQIAELNPFLYHLVNLGLHCSVAAIALLALRQLKLQSAFWIAMAFAVHPIQVETVAWVTEIKNLLSAFFYGLAWLVLYPEIIKNPVRHPRDGVVALFNARYLAGIVLFLAALLSKSVTASLPAALLLADWFHHGVVRRRPWIQLIPLLLLGCLFGLRTASLEANHVGASGGGWDYGFLMRIMLCCQSLQHYVFQLLFPLQQIFFYPRFDSTAIHWSGVQACLCVGMISIACSWLAIRGYRKPLFAWLFFVGSAFPALGMINVYPHRFSFVADHFIYIPSIAIISVIVGGIYTVSQSIRHRFPAFGCTLGLMPCLLLVTWFGIQTSDYIPAFANSRMLWEDTLAKNPQCPAALQNLGLEYLEMGKPELAELVLLEALNFDFDRHQTQNSLGLVYAQQGKGEQAVEAFRQAVKLKPAFALAWLNLGNLTQSMAAGEDRNQQLPSAIGYYESSWEADPTIQAAYGVAALHLELGNCSEAAKWIRRALELDPADEDSIALYTQVIECANSK